MKSPVSEAAATMGPNPYSSGILLRVCLYLYHTRIADGTTMSAVGHQQALPAGQTMSALPLESGRRGTGRQCWLWAMSGHSGPFQAYQNRLAFGWPQRKCGSLLGAGSKGAIAPDPSRHRITCDLGFKVNKRWNCSITRRDFVGKAAITAFGAAITTSGPGM
jgi:hypothetical protein